MAKVQVSEYSKTKYMAYLQDELIEKINIALLRNEKFIDIDDEIIYKLNQDVEAQKIKNDRINSCANLNNQGISFEKSGDTVNAIKVYEKNILDDYPATHSYDRLIKLYRKLKQYQDELRILNLAVKVFSKENDRRFNKAVSDPKNAKHIGDLQTAHETCMQFKGDDGWFIYVPYPVMNYIEQIAKCKSKLK